MKLLFISAGLFSLIKNLCELGSKWKFQQVLLPRVINKLVSLAESRDIKPASDVSFWEKQSFLLSLPLLHSSDGIGCARQYLQLVEELILGLYNLQASWDEHTQQQTTRSVHETLSATALRLGAKSHAYRDLGSMQ